MNATGDSEQDAELLTPESQGMPLSAPVAASMLEPRELGAYFSGPGDSVLARPPAGAEPPAPAPRRARYPGPVAAMSAGPPDPATEPGPDDSVPDPPEPAGSGPADWSSYDPAEDPHRVWMRERLDAARARAASASSWLETSVHYARLLNRDGIVPVTARFTRDDIEFLGRAREEVLGFAELGQRLLELHAPLDAGGISTDPSSPILRCRSCMWRWPCPTFRMLTDALSHLPPPGSPPAR
jgi:hypothetical protein